MTQSADSILKLKKVVFTLLAVVVIVTIGAAVFRRYSFNSSAKFNGYRTIRYSMGNPDVNFTAWIADDPERQQKGLSGVKYLSNDQAMLFSFNKPSIHSFWMKDMLMPIDIVWLKNSEVIGIDKNIQPEPGVSEQNLHLYSIDEETDGVLEFSAGWSDRNGVKTGDHLSQVIAD